MLKRNLFAIIIASFVLVFTGNAFGQWHPEIDKIKSPRDVATGQIVSPRDAASGLPTGIKSPRDISTGKSAQKSNIYANNIGGGLLGIKENNKNCKWEFSEFDSTKNLSTKPKGYNLGDTATHERKKRRN